MTAERVGPWLALWWHHHWLNLNFFSTGEYLDKKEGLERISGRISVVETISKPDIRQSDINPIRKPDIRLVSNALFGYPAGYPVIYRISGQKNVSSTTLQLSILLCTRTRYYSFIMLTVIYSGFANMERKQPKTILDILLSEINWVTKNTDLYIRIYNYVNHIREEGDIGLQINRLSH